MMLSSKNAIRYPLKPLIQLQRYLGYASSIPTTSNAKNWREAASLIIASEPQPNHPKKLEYLLLERSATSSFMPGGLCFPGGTLSLPDSSHKWSDLFNSAGIKLNELKFMNADAKVPELYKHPEEGESLSREITLRITSIRETFEECGILICKPYEGNHLESFMKDTRGVKDWQKKVMKEPEEFVNLCKELKILPDLKSLIEWSNWLTPVSYRLKKHRFDTMFYMVLLDGKLNRPQFVVDGEEMVGAVWLSASELLDGHVERKHLLLPPQAYEMMRLKHIHTAEELEKLFDIRNQQGIERWCPFMYGTKDECVISTFPGDSFYPTNPDIYNYQTFQKLDKTLVELEKDSVKKHRIIFKDGKPSLEISGFKHRFGHVYNIIL